MLCELHLNDLQRNLKPPHWFHQTPGQAGSLGLAAGQGKARRLWAVLPAFPSVKQTCSEGRWRKETDLDEFPVHHPRLQCSLAGSGSWSPQPGHPEARLLPFLPPSRAREDGCPEVWLLLCDITPIWFF
jgi:hypothetical protein